MTKTPNSSSTKKQNFKPLIIGVAIFGGVGLVLLGVFIFSIVWAFSSEPDEAALERNITSQVGGIGDARASYGHSGAPWNNNLAVWLQVNEDDTAYELTGYTKEVSRVILDSTKGTPNYQVSINYVVGSLEEEGSVSFAEGVDPRYYQKICNVLFEGASCQQSISVTKKELENIF